MEVFAYKFYISNSPGECILMIQSAVGVMYKLYVFGNMLIALIVSGAVCAFVGYWAWVCIAICCIGAGRA